jgi:hypothetical protein
MVAGRLAVLILTGGGGTYVSNQNVVAPVLMEI